MPKVTTLPAKKARKINTLVVMNPSKGLNNLGSPLLIDNREFSDMLNMEYDETGVIRKRAGYSAVGTALTAAKGLGTLTTETLNYLVTIDGTSMKYLNSGVWTTVSGASFTTGQETCFSQANNKIYVWNGSDGGASWDGTTLTRPGTMPKGKFAVFYNNVHLVSGVPGQPNRLYVSQNNDSSAFTVATPPPSLSDSTNVPGATVFTGSGASYIDVRKNDGDQITGLIVFQGVVLVFKRKSTYQLTFDTSATPQPVITPVSDATGCVSHKTLQQVENDILFLSLEGVRRIGNDPGYLSSNGSTIRTHIISLRIDTTIKTLYTANASKANACYVNNRYQLFFPTTSSTVSTGTVYDNRFDAWTVWDTITPNTMVRYIDTNNAQHTYYMSDTGTQMYEIVAGQYNDAGAAINSYIVSKAQGFNVPDVTKRFVDCTLFFRSVSGFITCQIYLDGSISAGTATVGPTTSDGMGLSAMGSVAFGTGTGSTSTVTNTDVAERVVVGQNSRTMKFKISNNRVNENFVFLGYTFGYYVQSHFLFDSTYKIYV